jgi:hypothetical protein
MEISQLKPEKVFALGRNWLLNPSARLRQTALIFFPVLVDTHATPLLEVLDSLGAEEDHGVRKALVQALLVLGTKGHSQSVLGLLSSWSDHSQPNGWVICRTLSAPWVRDYSSEVVTILTKLISRGGNTQTIAAALKSLKRNGLVIDLEPGFGNDENKETKCR